MNPGKIEMGNDGFQDAECDTVSLVERLELIVEPERKLIQQVCAILRRSAFVVANADAVGANFTGCNIGRLWQIFQNEPIIALDVLDRESSRLSRKVVTGNLIASFD